MDNSMAAKAGGRCDEDEWPVRGGGSGRAGFASQVLTTDCSNSRAVRKWGVDPPHLIHRQMTVWIKDQYCPRSQRFTSAIKTHGKAIEMDDLLLGIDA